MKKILKIQFWKAEKALAMQVLEQEGLPRRKEEGFVRINDVPWLYDERIDLRGHDPDHDWDVNRMTFDTNDERDEYLQKAVNAITEELFKGKGELKIGEMCEVRDDEDEQWERRKLLAILPEGYKYRFLAEHGKYPTQYCKWKYARSIPEQIKPKFENCGSVLICTWEE